MLVRQAAILRRTAASGPLIKGCPVTGEGKIDFPPAVDHGLQLRFFSRIIRTSTKKLPKSPTLQLVPRAARKFSTAACAPAPNLWEPSFVLWSSPSPAPLLTLGEILSSPLSGWLKLSCFLELPLWVILTSLSLPAGGRNYPVLSHRRVFSWVWEKSYPPLLATGSSPPILLLP